MWSCNGRLELELLRCHRVRLTTLPSPRELAELAREVDVSDARELVYEFFSIEDRGIV